MEKIKNLVKLVVFSNDLIYFLYINFTIPMFKKKIKDKVGYKIFKHALNRKEVVEEVISRRKLKNTDTCHVVASGWSLNYSLSLISDDSFVIGFNYAALSNIKFDVYFFEIGSDKFEELSNNSLILAKNKLLKEGSLIYFKNLWEDCNDVDFIVENWMEVSRIIKDRFYSISSNYFIDRVVSHAFNDNSKFLPQICSTTVTSIILAYRAGFKKIIVHGLDFGGYHFYGVDGFIPNDAVKDLVQVSLSNTITKDTVHKTAQGIGMKEIIPSMYEYLKIKDVELLSATEKSPLSKIIPVYEKDL